MRDVGGKNAGNAKRPSTLLSQCSIRNCAVHSSSVPEGMKVVLASYYRLWMLALFPTTLGVGTLALWWRSLNWPLRIDAMRSHCAVTVGCGTRLAESAFCAAIATAP
jgi:hypothetical protein